MPLAEILTPLKAALVNVAEWVDGETGVSEESSPPRFGVVRENGRATAAGAVKSAENFGRILHAVKLHVWGKTPDHCELMLAAFETAASSVCATLGEHSYEIGAFEWHDVRSVEAGTLLVADVTFGLPRVRVKIPATPGGDILPRTRTYVQINKVAFNTTGETDGDGVLVAPNK